VFAHKSNLKLTSFLNNHLQLYLISQILLRSIELLNLSLSIHSSISSNPPVEGFIALLTLIIFYFAWVPSIKKGQLIHFPQASSV